MADFSHIKHFTPEQFGNPAALNQKLVEMLDDLAGKLGLPMTINSDYRSPDHNAAVGGVKNSAHTRGDAVDAAVPPVAVEIKVTPGAYVYDVVAMAMAVGFYGIGINKKTGTPTGFIHLEVRPSISRAMWSY